MSKMPELDALFGSYSHLRTLSRQEDALHTLQRLASVVKPIMRAQAWRVEQLAEFYPEQRNLLGLNVNRTRKILVRLRYPGDVNQFLPFEEVVDTLLHELAHIVHGAHDSKFHALWDQLRSEHEGLLRSGFTGDGFLSAGHRLGGTRIPMDEARRIARAAAERRRAERGDTGHRLGGAAPRPGDSIRTILASAASKRQPPSDGCGNIRDADEIQKIDEAATRNGFRTKAEEDKANEDAIAQALWELVQEQEKARLGDAYVPPRLQLLPEHSAGVPKKRPVTSPETYPDPLPKRQMPSQDQTTTAQWACRACTLINAHSTTRCGACETERLQQAPTHTFRRDRSGRPLEVVDLTLSPTPNSKSPRRAVRDRGDSRERKSEAKPKAALAFWNCLNCKTRMEGKWWACSKCGKIKESS